jgi:hypothetical protein
VDDLFTFFLIFIFFVLPVLERVLKGKKKPPPGTSPPRERPEARPVPERRPLPEPRAEWEQPEPVEQESTADELIPDDLWAILTGERRPEPPPTRPAPPPPQRPAPAPRRAPPPPLARKPQPTAARKVDEFDRVQRRTEAVRYRESEAELDALLRSRRRIDEPAPMVVSLEGEPLPEGPRHDRFHDRLDKLTAPPTGYRKATVLPSLRDPMELRRAIILKEVLGKPKGLQLRKPDRG